MAKDGVLVRVLDPHEKLAMKAAIPQMPGIAAFSDDIRDALRGPFSDDHKPGSLVALQAWKRV